MESKKLEKPRKNGALSTLRGVMNPHEEDRGVFPTKQPAHSLHNSILLLDLDILLRKHLIRRRQN